MTKHIRGSLATATCIAVMSILSTSAAAQQKPGPPKPKWAATDVLPLARVSLANRDLTFPNTREAGLEAGKSIANDCKADPNALLFAIVDNHVRQVAESSTNAGK